MALRTTPFLWLGLIAGLAGCAVEAPPPQAIRRPEPVLALTDRRVAILLPMTGPQAALGQSMLQAAQLALGKDGPQLDVQDTGGTPTGATTATVKALAAHDTFIIGPLTAPETAAAAQAAMGVPILAFTSDRQQARPAVWTLGIEPEQQVERLVQVLAARGKTRIAAVLPDNSFGTALAAGLGLASVQLAQPPSVHRYMTGSRAGLEQALRDATGYDQRRGAIEARAKAAQDAGGDDAAAIAASIRAETPPPPDFDALLLAESGPLLQATATALANDDIHIPAVQVVGPATWAREAANLTGLTGAWYAAPDPVAREDFVRAFTARYGGPPPAYADLAYDAARVARSAVAAPGVLTRPQGFAGVDGPFVLLPDGRLRRGLAVFAVGPGGAQIVEPAPSFASGS
jgi:ABC-type branched-subunit amino acid transport system substrate-binding protein